MEPPDKNLSILINQLDYIFINLGIWGIQEH